MTPPKHVSGKVVTTPRTSIRDDGRLWMFLGGGPLIEHIAGVFVEMFPGAEADIDDVLEEVWIWEPHMAAEEYANLGVKVSVEWFRRN